MGICYSCCLDDIYTNGHCSDSPSYCFDSPNHCSDLPSHCSEYSPHCEPCLNHCNQYNYHRYPQDRNTPYNLPPYNPQYNSPPPFNPDAN